MKNKMTRKYRRKPPKKNYLDYPITSIEAEENEAVGGPTLFSNVHTRIIGLAERSVKIKHCIYKLLINY